MSTRAFVQARSDFEKAVEDTNRIIPSLARLSAPGHIPEEGLPLIATVLRAADAYLHAVADIPQPSEETVKLIEQVRLMRGLAFLLLAQNNSDQAWFWTEEWQAKEREADASLAEGRTTFYASDEEFDQALRARMHL